VEAVANPGSSIACQKFACRDRRSAAELRLSVTLSSSCFIVQVLLTELRSTIRRQRAVGRRSGTGCLSEAAVIALRQNPDKPSFLTDATTDRSRKGHRFSHGWQK